MARLPRLDLPGLAHLLVLRGQAGMPVVVDEQDRQALLAALRESALQHRVAVEAYTLDAQHLHLLLRPAAAGALAATMQGLGRRYVAAFNRRHGRSGSPWAGRYRATPLQGGAAVRDAMLFIDSHAHRHGQADEPGQEAWSSAAHHLGRRRDPLLTDGPDWWALGNTPFERELAWQQLLAEGLPAARVHQLAEASHKGWPVGDAPFLSDLARQAQRPVQPRPRGRPPAAR